MTKRLTMVLVMSVALALSSPAVVGCQSEESTTTEDATTTQERGTTSQDATTTASSSTVGPETLTTLTAWGENFFGQLGNGVTLPYGSHSNTPVEVSALEGAEVKAISGGQLHSLALKDDDTVWAWDDNTSSQGTRIGGQLGDSEITSSNTPVQVGELPGGVEAIAAGASHGLALKDDGTVWAWGSNQFGQLGDGITTDSTPTTCESTGVGAAVSFSCTDSNTPVRMSEVGGITAIAAGGAHGLTLKDEGTVWAWGSNERGQLGNGTETLGTNTLGINTPVQVSNLSGVKAIAAGSDHNLAGW